MKGPYECEMTWAADSTALLVGEAAAISIFMNGLIGREETSSNHGVGVDVGVGLA